MTGAAFGQIVLVGAGNMGGAMLAGWLKSGVPGSSVTVLDPGPSEKMMSLITSLLPKGWSPTFFSLPSSRR
jgi:pyrroline-5-carboxylate reductase